MWQILSVSCRWDFHVTNTNSSQTSEAALHTIYIEVKKSIPSSSIWKSKKNGNGRGRRRQRREHGNLMPKISQTNESEEKKCPDQFWTENIDWIALNELIKTKRRGTEKNTKNNIENGKSWNCSMVKCISCCFVVFIHCIQWHQPSMILDFALFIHVYMLNVQ